MIVNESASSVAKVVGASVRHRHTLTRSVSLTWTTDARPRPRSLVLSDSGYLSKSVPVPQSIAPRRVWHGWHFTMASAREANGDSRDHDGGEGEHNGGGHDSGDPDSKEVSR